MPTWLRVVSIGLGLGVGAAGGVAVFVTSNGTGSLALLAVGALFVLLGLTGQQIRSFKLGGNEVVLSDAVSEQYFRGDEEGALAEVEQQLKRAVGAGEGVQSPLQGPRLERELSEHVTQAARDLGGDAYQLVAQEWFDAIVGIREWRVGVDIRTGTNFSPPAVAGHLLAACIQAKEAGHSVYAVMVVVNADKPDPARFGSLNAALVAARLGRNTVFVTPDDRDPRATIRAALQSILDYLDKRRQVEGDSGGMVPPLGPLPYDDGEVTGTP